MPHLVFSFVKLQAVLSSDKVAVAKNVQGFQTKFFKAFLKFTARWNHHYAKYLYKNVFDD